MSDLSVNVIINMITLAEIFSVLCIGKTVVDSSVLLKDLYHPDKSVENIEIDPSKNYALMWNSRKLGP